MTLEEAHQHLLDGGELTRREQLEVVNEALRLKHLPNGTFAERHQNVPAELIVYGRDGFAVERIKTEVEYEGFFSRYRVRLPLDLGWKNRKNHAVLFIDGEVEIKAPPVRT